MPTLGGFPSEYCLPVSYGKTRMIVTVTVKKSEDISTRFDRMYERDRQTDRHRMTAKAALEQNIARQKCNTR